MKKILLVLLVLFTACNVFSQSQWQKRIADSKICIAETGSYGYVATINVSSANWTCPDSIKILAICVDSAGTVCVSTSDADSVRLKKPNEFCYPVAITKIYKIGTDSLLRSGYIEVYGFKKK